MGETKQLQDGSTVDSRDSRTVGFTAAEFGNAWAMSRAEAFGTNDLSSFQEEWSAWLKAHDAEVIRKAAADLTAAADSIASKRP